jgi:hypothetical protein
MGHFQQSSVREGDIVKRMALLLLMLLFACSKAQVEDEGLVDVITLEEECGDSPDVCCEGACRDFCKAAGRVYAKETPNGSQCGCWCD